MFSFFKRALRSFDIHYQFISVNANGMPFQNIKEYIVVTYNTKFKENQIPLNY